jgi:putative endonuclease
VWYVYFLELSNGDVYVGSTNDLRRRFASHQNGQVTSTSKNLPVVLRSYVAVASEPHARRLERYFKSGSGKAFANKRLLEALPRADRFDQKIRQDAKDGRLDELADRAISDYRCRRAREL